MGGALLVARNALDDIIPNSIDVACVACVACVAGQTHHNADVPKLLSEDCLNLNVWAPVGTTNASSLPVAIFFHGGSFAEGSDQGVARDRGALVVPCLCVHRDSSALVRSRLWQHCSYHAPARHSLLSLMITPLCCVENVVVHCCGLYAVGDANGCSAAILLMRTGVCVGLPIARDRSV